MVLEIRTMKVLYTVAFALAALGLGIFLHTPTTQAAYNPSNILRDDIFTNKDAMSEGDIQNFLTSNNSCLATADPSSLGPTTSSAAKLINDAAKNANGGQGINPQVVLVTLQKEWSLVTMSCAQLDALYGNYGGGPQVYLKRALGYNVPDVLGIGDCLYSFSAQLNGNICNGDSYLGSPGSMRRSYSTNQVGPGGAAPFPQAFSIQEYSDKPGNVTINPQTKATAVLFRYTPYAYYGNYNFYNTFNAWFGNPACPANLSLYKGSGADLYAVKDGVRYRIANPETVSAWGMYCLDVANVSDDQINSFGNGGSITRVVRDTGTGYVFIVMNGSRRHIRTPRYVDQLGLSGEPVVDLPSNVINAIPEAAPLGFLVKASGQSAIYLAQLNSKYYVPNIPTIEAWGFTLSELVEVTSSFVDSLPTAGNLTVLTKGSHPETYLASEHNLVYIPSLQRVRDWDLQNFSLTVLDDQFLDSLPKTGVLSKVTRGSGTSTYYVSDGTRKYISTLSAARQYDAQYGPLIKISDTIIGRIAMSGVIK